MRRAFRTVRTQPATTAGRHATSSAVSEFHEASGHGAPGGMQGLARQDVIATVRAELLLAAAPEVVFTFLANLRNHRRMSDRYLRLTRLFPDQQGAWIVIGAPLGLRRTARTVLTSACAPAWLVGTAAVGRRTSALVRWSIERRGECSRVALTATVLDAGRLDRLLLALGGRWWLRRRFECALARLAQAFGATDNR